MEFFRKNEQAEFQKGDVIRFKNSVDTSYHYAIIAKLPGDVITWNDNERVIANPVDKYAAVILDNNYSLCAGDTYRIGKSIQELIDDLSVWDIVEKAKTRTEDLTD